MLVSIAHWLEQHMLPCFYKKILGIPCPGCGMQRALVEFLQGNLVESFKLYPALLPILLMFIFLLLHLKFNFRFGGDVLKFFFILNMAIIIFSYILRITCKY